MSSSNNNDNNAKEPWRLPNSVAIGLMQWGTTRLDDKVVNPKGNMTEDTARGIYQTCVDQGIVLFDTAEGYGGGTSEVRFHQVQEWYKEQSNSTRPNMVVCTKYLPTLWRLTEGAFQRAVQGSMDRLGVDSLDLYLIHTPIHPFITLETMVHWMCRATKAGKIQRMGLSNCSASQVKAAQAVADQYGLKIVCNQIMLNLLVWKSPALQETVQTCQDMDIAIMAYSPIGQGLLTRDLTVEKYHSIRAVKMTGVQYDDDLKALRSCLQGLADKYQTSMAQIAMNWVRVGHGAIPLVGCRTVDQVQEVAASRSFALTQNEIEELNDKALSVSLFERPKWRRSLFVVFISLLQIMYRTELAWTRFHEAAIAPIHQWWEGLLGGKDKKEHAN